MYCTRLFYSFKLCMFSICIYLTLYFRESYFTHRTMSEQSDPGIIPEHSPCGKVPPRAPTPHSVPSSTKICSDEQYGFPCTASRLVTPYGGGVNRQLCREYLCRTQSLGADGVYVVVPNTQPHPRLSVERLL